MKIRLWKNKKVAQLEGLFICPEGAATFLAARRLREEGWIKENETVVALNTGLGVKYPNTVDIEVPILERNGSLTKNKASEKIDLRLSGGLFLCHHTLTLI